jgi:Transposase IS116/IS110/IS902 family/Transposase
MTARKTKPTPSPRPTAHAQRKARAKAKTAAVHQAHIDQVNALPIRNRHAAGIDVGSRSHWVCVGFCTDADADLIREFPAHTEGLRALAAYLHEHGVTTVALESSGIYWIPLYELLESEGLQVLLVVLDLLEIEGIDERTALVVLGELGTDLSKFATVKQFCSWLGLCPQWHKTGGQVQSSRTRPGVNRVAVALRLAAHSLHHSKSALGAYYRRQKSRLGAASATTATAHKLARLVYYALTKGLPYVKQSPAQYEAQVRAQQIASLKKKARRLGLHVQEPGGAPPAAGASNES